MNDSFSIGPQQAVNPAAPVSAGAVQQSSSGGNLSNSTSGAGVFIGDVTQSGSSRTFLALTALAKEMLEPHVKQRETELFFEGMQKSLQGQGIKEVIDEQPGFSTMFGRNSVIRGASAAEAMVKVDQFADTVAQNMPEWRKLTPEQVRKEMLNIFPKMYTGDPVTDSAVQQKMLESVGPMMKLQVKEHMKWKNEDYFQKRSDLLLSSAKSLQNIAAAAARDPASESAQVDLNNSTAALLALAKRPDGYDTAAHEKMFLGVVRSAAQSGNFHAVRALLASPEVAGLDPAKVASAADFADKQEHAVFTSTGLLKFHTAQGIDNGKFSTGDMPPEEWLNRTLARNAEFAKATGITKPFMDGKAIQAQMEQGTTGAIRARKAAEQETVVRLAKATDEAEKQRVKLAEVSEKVAAFARGDYIPPGHPGGSTKDEVDAAVAGWYFENLKKDPDAARMSLAATFNRNGGHVNPIISNAMQQGILAGMLENWTPKFQESFDEWHAIYKLPGGANAALKYVADTPDLAGKLEEYRALTSMQGVSKEAAYFRAFRVPRERVKMEKEDRKALREAVESDLSAWFSWDRPQHTVEAAAHMLEPYWQRFTKGRPAHDKAVAIKHVRDLAAADGVEIQGDLVWKNEKGQAPFHATVEQHLDWHSKGGFDVFNTALNEVLVEKAKAVGIGTTLKGKPDIAYAHVVRLADKGTIDANLKRDVESTLEVQLLTADGTKTVVIKNTDVRNKLKARADREIAGSTQGGAYIGFRPK